jgi:hypothetical protein
MLSYCLDYYSHKFSFFLLSAYPLLRLKQSACFLPLVVAESAAAADRNSIAPKATTNKQHEIAPRNKQQKG